MSSMNDEVTKVVSSMEELIVGKAVRQTLSACSNNHRDSDSDSAHVLLGRLIKRWIKRWTRPPRSLPILLLISFPKYRPPRPAAVTGAGGVNGGENTGCMIRKTNLVVCEW
jgi:hypothetical protein